MGQVMSFLQHRSVPKPSHQPASQYYNTWAYRDNCHSHLHTWAYGDILTHTVSPRGCSQFSTLSSCLQGLKTERTYLKWGQMPLMLSLCWLVHFMLLGTWGAGLVCPREEHREAGQRFLGRGWPHSSSSPYKPCSAVSKNTPDKQLMGILAEQP